MGASESKQDVFYTVPELLNDIVDRVIVKNGSRRFELPRSASKSNVLKIEKELNDIDRPLKDIATDFVVDEFFSSETSLYRFLTLVYKIFDKSLEIYRKKRNIKYEDCFFLYKGGNILRIVSSQFLLQLPISATREINNFYSQFFKRSDADFTIYLDPNIYNYDDIFYELTLLSYLLQIEIRNEFNKRPMYYFDFATRNGEYKEKVLTSYLNKMNSVDERQYDSLILGNGKSNGDKPYVTLPDQAIRFIENDYEKEIRYASIVDIMMDNSPFRITYNTALDFPKGTTNTRTKFALVRTKIEMNLYRGDQKKSVAGELIDVSISHKLDTKLQDFSKHALDSITTYKLKYEDKILDFKSYNLKYLIEDLEEILFKAVNVPWDDRKYQKRINRLFYLYFVDIFIKIEGGSKRLSILEYVRNKIFRPLTVSNYNNIEKFVAPMELFLTRYGRYNLYFNSLLQFIYAILTRLTSSDINEMKEMCKLLQTNVDIVADALQDVITYCTVDGSATVDDIYDTKTKVLL